MCLSLSRLGSHSFSFCALQTMDDIMDQPDDLFPYPDLNLNDSLGSNETVSYVALSPAMNKAVNLLLIIVLSVTMVSMGCTMEVSKIKQHIMRPKGVAIAALSQYGVMPLTAFCLTKAFNLTDMRAVVVLICGCCPGGALSNIMALAVKGDMNLSIVMTTFSTVLALGMMPLLLFIYCQGFDNLQDAVPYAEITASLAMILVPCGIGILINHYRPKYSAIILKMGLILLLCVVVAVSAMVTIDIGGSVLTVLVPPLIAISALMPFIGYTFGYVISSLFKLTHSQRRTVAMETGCQNIQLCSTILKTAFASTQMGPLFLFPIVFGTLSLIHI